MNKIEKLFERLPELKKGYIMEGLSPMIRNRIIKKGVYFPLEAEAILKELNDLKISIENNYTNAESLMDDKIEIIHPSGIGKASMMCFLPEYFGGYLWQNTNKVYLHDTILLNNAEKHFVANDFIGVLYNLGFEIYASLHGPLGEVLEKNKKTFTEEEKVPTNTNGDYRVVESYILTR